MIFYHRFRKSYVSIVVLILMLVLVAASYLYADALFSELAIARNNKGAAVAFSLAEAGVQEAIWRIQYETSIGGARDTFLNTTGGTTTFDHDPALLNNGAYSATIQNTAKAAATVTAIGTYRVGLRTARREIKVGIAKATNDAYPYDGAIFGAGGAGSSIADIDFWAAVVKIYNGSVISNRDVDLKFGADVDVEGTFEIIDDIPVPSGRAVEVHDRVSISATSHLDCNCLINDDGIPETPQCSPPPGCTPVEGTEVKTMPQIDFDSSSPNSFKQRAIADGQYFTRQKDFKDLIPKDSTATFNGVVYIDGPLHIDYDRIINMNGVLAASGSITITNGQLTINIPPEPDVASGVITQRDFIVGPEGKFSGTGLVYTGDRAQIDSNASVDYTVNLIGGILSRRTWVSGFRYVNITRDDTVIENGLGDPSDTPIIVISHWEEEY